MISQDGWEVAKNLRSLQPYTPEVFSADRRQTAGGACSVCEVKGCEKIRIQIDSGAGDTVGPKEMAEALKMQLASGRSGVAPRRGYHCRASSRRGGGLLCIVHCGGRAPVGGPCRGTGESLGGS